MARALLALAFLSTAAACGEAPTIGRRRGTPDPDGLWVLTYNVNFERPSESTVEAIASADADLVFLQETHARWERSIRERLGDRYPHIVFHHEPAEGGLAILSRHAFEEVEHGRSPEGAFPTWAVRVSTPLGDLDVLHVHLHPPLDEDGRLITGYFTTGPTRQRELAHHLDAFDDPPDLVLGDFNEAEGEAVRNLEALGLREAQAIFPPVERTWTWRTGGTEISGRPDHIFVGGDLRVTAVQVMEEGASDHRPFRARISR